MDTSQHKLPLYKPNGKVGKVCLPSPPHCLVGHSWIHRSMCQCCLLLCIGTFTVVIAIRFCINACTFFEALCLEIMLPLGLMHQGNVVQSVGHDRVVRANQLNCTFWYISIGCFPWWRCTSPMMLYVSDLFRSFSAPNTSAQRRASIR